MSRCPTETQRAIVDALLAGLRPLRADAPLSLSRWAAEHFKLSAESSHKRGDWEAYPFQHGLLDWMGDDAIREVTVRKAKRVGYTKMLLAKIAYNIAHRRRKQAIWQPTDDDRDSFVKAEIDPMLRDVAAVRPFLLAGKEDTLKLKQFLGSVLHTLGAKAARAFRRITLDDALLDEVDGMDAVVEKSSDPITLARGRLEGAAFPKLIAGTTPRVKGASLIEGREKHADAFMRYHVVCPHCSLEHPLLWGGKDVRHGFKGGGLGGDVGPVRHVCPHCHEPISQAEYLSIWRDGAWVSQCGQYRYGQDRTWRNAEGQPRPAPAHVAAHVWTAYSPQREWTDIVREFLEATAEAKAGQKGPLMGFVNETLGELWEEVFEKADEHALQRRANAEPKPYRRFTVPMGGLVLVTGIDSQDDRWECVTWAIGRGEEMWCVDYSVIYGNPADEREWADKLDPYLETIFQHANGRPMRIEAAAVDTGGHFTHQAYNYCRLRERRRVFAVKGDDKPTKMIKGKATVQDVNWRGKVLKRGVRLWYVGTDTAKDLFFGRLHVGTAGPGYVHFCADLPATFYTGLTAESRVPVRTARGVDYKWVNTRRARNEPLDCTVYALFCTHALGLHLRTSKEWDRLEAAVQPAIGDLFEPPAQPAPAAEEGAIVLPEEPPGGAAPLELEDPDDGVLQILTAAPTRTTPRSGPYRRPMPRR
jgi:phage terminase large subunit GpA-like protein